jgi:molecular chaperone GrpE
MQTNENAKEEKKEESQPESQETKAETKAQPEVSDEKKEEVDYKSKFFYIAAEFDNFRKRAEREKIETVHFGNQRIIQDMLEVLDNFERTINMLRPDEDQKVKNLVFGLDMIEKQFLGTLAKHGLKPIEALGKDFDPNFHEAMAQEYAEGKKPNEVIKEFQKGYVLNGRVIRATKVVVASDKQ